MKIKIDLQDHSPEVLRELESKCLVALEKCGLVAEGYAKQLRPVDTGNLRNSISHNISTDGSQKIMNVGSAIEYAIYQEMGTGKYADGGRDTPWAYQDSRGNWHRTFGNKAQPFIKPSVSDHVSQYKGIIEDELK